MEIIHYHFHTLNSTNDWGKEQISSFDKEKITLITADMQSRGRGEYGKKWIGPEGKNIYASFCFYIEETQKETLSLTHVMAISAIKTLEKRGLLCRIKWPNDVMVGLRKIAGILCETVHLAPYFGVIIGIGLNVNMSLAHCATIDQPATSLFAETGKEETVGAVLTCLKTHFLQDLTLFMEKGFQPFLPLFRQLILPGARDTTRT